MKFDKYNPTERLKPYINCLVVSENADENTYKVFPSTGLVLGFQYKGYLNSVRDNTAIKLASSGITGISDHFKIFRNTAGTGTVLVYFSETAYTSFSSSPAHEIFNQSVSLEHLFDRYKISETEEKLATAATDRQRVHIVEQFLISQLKEIQSDKLIVEAVKLIHRSGGNIRIKELNEKLCISSSPFEKRFRKLVGTTPKKFASIVRFNAVLNTIDPARTLADICYENNFFDQAHFIKDFKRYTGDTPENFKRSL